jgi:hypothetical protein
VAHSGDGIDWDADEVAGPALEFEAWADISARLLNLPDDERARILESAKVELEVWSQSDAYYSDVIAADVQRGDVTRASAYGARCAVEMARRKALVAKGAPTASSTPDRAQSSHPLAQTTMGGPSLESDGGPGLPFQKGGVVRSPEPRGIPEREISGTLDLARPAGGPATPFENVAPRLSLEQYAVFRAELGVHPEREMAIQSQYGIRDANERRDLDEAFRRLFATDPESRRRFRAISTEHRDRLLAEKSK